MPKVCFIIWRYWDTSNSNWMRVISFIQSGREALKAHYEPVIIVLMISLRLWNAESWIFYRAAVLLMTECKFNHQCLREDPSLIRLMRLESGWMIWSDGALLLNAVFKCFLFALTSMCLPSIMLCFSCHSCFPFCVFKPLGKKCCISDLMRKLREFRIEVSS